MGELGRVLGLMHGAHTSFASLTAVADCVYDTRLHYAAFERARATGHVGFGAVGMPSDPASETTWKLWVEQPSRIRAEQSGRRPGRPPGPCTMVVDDQRWWSWDEKYGARFGTGHPTGMASFTSTGLEALLDPRALLSTHRGFSLGDRTVIGGREAIRLHARHGGHGADTFDTEIAVDANAARLARRRPV